MEHYVDLLKLFEALQKNVNVRRPKETAVCIVFSIIQNSREDKADL